MNNIYVSEIRVRNRRLNDKELMYADITINDAIVIHRVKLLKNSNDEHYIIFPEFLDRRKGKYSQVVHPINNEVRKLLTKAMLDEYLKIQRESFYNKKLCR